MLQRVEDFELDLGLVLAVHLEIMSRNANLGGQDVDGLGCLSFRDDDVTEERRCEIGRTRPSPELNSPWDILLEDKLERLDQPLLALLKVALSGNDRVLHEHRDRHGSDSSRDGRDVGSDLDGGVVVDIANKTRA